MHDASELKTREAQAAVHASGAPIVDIDPFADAFLAGAPVRRLNNTLHAFESLPVKINLERPS